MLFMAIATWGPENRDKVIARFIEQGPTVPEGLELVNEWADLTGGRAFRLYETDSPVAFIQAIQVWSDLMKIEAVPVMGAVETADGIVEVLRKEKD